MGQKIAELMKENHVTHEQLAEAVGVSAAFISYIVRGYKNPSVALLKRIADYFMVSTDEIIGDM